MAHSKKRKEFKIAAVAGCLIRQRRERKEYSELAVSFIFHLNYAFVLWGLQ